MNQAYRMEQPPHLGPAPDAQDGQSSNPYLETGYTQVVDYPEYRNIGPIYQASSSCSTEPVYTEPPTTEHIYTEPATESATAWTIT